MLRTVGRSVAQYGTDICFGARVFELVVREEDGGGGGGDVVDVSVWRRVGGESVACEGG